MHSSPYSGFDQQFVGNGQGLSISNIGSSKILPINHSTSPLSLTDLLHVPFITKNLLSVSRLAKNNHVYFEFRSFTCLVKSQGYNEVLLRGSLDEHGLYQFTEFPLTHLSVVPSSASFPSTPSVASTTNKVHVNLASSHSIHTPKAGPFAN